MIFDLVEMVKILKTVSFLTVENPNSPCGGFQQYLDTTKKEIKQLPT
jgi:hypothetical protein